MITVIGDLVVDLIVKTAGNHYGTDTESSITTHAGGQANHVAAWVTATGGESTLIGRVGTDLYGDFLMKDAKQHGVQVAIEKDKHEETGKIVILVDNQNSERTMFNDRGANKKLNLEQMKQAESVIKTSSCLYISGYSFFEETTREAIEYAKQFAKDHHVPVAIDPSSTYFINQHKDYVLEFIRGSDFLFPNVEEGIMLTGKQRPEDIMRKLKFFVKHPVLTLGEEGCMFFCQERLVQIKAEQVTPIDSTGAGDTFNGAFLSNYFTHKDVKKAAQFANKTAAQTVQRVGGRPPL